MGCFSCCFGGKVKEEDAVLLPWAQLPADLQPGAPAGHPRGWRRAGTSGRGSIPVAPAFGAGALREDPWAPTDYKKYSGRYNYQSFNDPAPAPAISRTSPPPAADAARSSRLPFAVTAPASSNTAAALPVSTGGGWQSEPDWVREAALAAAAETNYSAASKPASGSGGGGGTGGHVGSKLSHLFSRQPGNDSENEDSAGGAAPRKKQARAGARQRQGQGQGHDKLLPRAPAFGQGALTKWH